MTEKKNVSEEALVESGGPCPPVADFGDDPPNALEVQADYEAEEKDEVTK